MQIGSSDYKENMNPHFLTPYYVLSALQVLLKGDPKKQLLCASDGYCQEDERCCPSPCTKKHLCMKGLLQKKAMQEEKQLEEGKGLLPDLEEEEEELFGYLAEE